ncbi:hypothetical protein QTN47_17810 [Danxiaibacter flavus]|uniref:Phosphoribosylpyrophosphate synthetase n=1 Tax=Danxiaibacter flavus TaxID=3049108 RepID=A0ABV3ZIP0_9BACT|nr:hypothetical protein QNM32_17820 [Chitinophagaceae bacterium DXS]
MKSSTEEMNTPVQIIERLRKNGYDHEFRWKPGGLAIEDKLYKPSQLKIIKTYRFEGFSDPSDMSVIYVIEADDHTIGWSMDAYGAYSSHEDEAGYDNIMRMIPVEGRDEQLLFKV